MQPCGLGWGVWVPGVPCRTPGGEARPPGRAQRAPARGLSRARSPCPPWCDSTWADSRRPRRPALAIFTAAPTQQLSPRRFRRRLRRSLRRRRFLLGACSPKKVGEGFTFLPRSVVLPPTFFWRMTSTCPVGANVIRCTRRTAPSIIFAVWGKAAGWERPFWFSFLAGFAALRGRGETTDSGHTEGRGGKAPAPLRA